MDKGEEGGTELVVTGCDMPELLELVEEALDEVALTIDRLLPAILPLAIGAVRNVGGGTLIANAGSHAVGVVTLVGDDDGARLEAVEQGPRARDVVVVSRRDQEADGPAFRIDPRVDFRREPAPASTDTTNATLFLTPEAC